MRARPLTWHTWVIVGIKVLAVAAALLIPAMPQPVSYHDFADHREMFGIRNFLDVASNFAFLAVGAWGLSLALGRRAHFEFTQERWPYAIFFLGVTLTAAGSAYYHVAPDNETLFWDRLPMTIAFMGLVCSQIVDRISIRAGLALLVPMLVLGAATVIYWRMTERAGSGNIVPYGVLQGYSVVVLLLLAVLNPSRYTHGKLLYWVFAWYVLSKVLETYDAQVLAWNHAVSGHTLKHLAAAIAGVAVCVMLTRRSLINPEAGRVAPSPGARAARGGDRGTNPVQSR
jgi:hypothetical protein